jgi:DNA repair exonuclease SbcCD ATPase subunit
MKCAECGTNYTGDRGLYRCNSLSKTGGRCGNNDISQRKAEQVVLSFIGQCVLKFNDVKKALDRVKKKFVTGEQETKALEKRLNKVEREIRRLVELYRREIIDAETIEAEMRPLREQKRVMTAELEKIKSANHGLEVSDDDIKRAIGLYAEMVEDADPQIKKRAVRALLKEVRIYPKDGKSKGRLIEIIGACLPLIRVNVVVPTGLEPVLPT